MHLVLDQLRATIEENVKRHLDSKLDRDKYNEAEDRKASVRDVFRISKKLDQLRDDHEVFSKNVIRAQQAELRKELYCRVQSARSYPA